MTDEGRPDVWPGVEDRADGPERVQPRALPGPLNSVLANQQFNICLGFVQECGRFESALPAPDHHDSLSAKMLKFRCSEECEANSWGSPPNCGGRTANGRSSRDDDAPASYSLSIG